MGLYQTECIVTPFHIEMSDTRDFAVRAFTNGLFGYSDMLNDTSILTTFVYSEPIGVRDQLNGGRCAVTGYWAASRDLVWTARGRAIAEFAQGDHWGEDK